MNLTLRNCTLEDAAMVLIWRNAEKVRNFSHNSREIEQVEHERWFSQKLREIQKEPFWIILSDGNNAGFVRYDQSKKYPGSMEVSILVADEYQRLGIARRILPYSMKRIKEEFGVHSIYADVHINNVVSLSLFNDSGFRFVSKDKNFETLQCLIESI